jgi:rhomboid protease GluP
VCRNCGALVGAGEPECGQCGAPTLARPTAQAQRERTRYDGDAMRFARAILTRPATFTIIFLVANIFVFLLMTLYGGSENPETLRAFGAKFNSLINEGQWWRFVTPVFMHIGPVHLIFNMYGLWMLGPYVERLYGSAKFVVFWVVSGIAGVAASYLTVVRPGMHDGPLGSFLFRSLDGPSAGASGALFGLIGVLFVFGIKFRHELPDGFKRAFGTGMLPTILINLFIGYVFPFIDNAAHLGGLACGAALALVVGYRRPHERAGVAIFWHVLQVAAIVVVVVSFFKVWRSYDGPSLSFNKQTLQRTVPGTGGSNISAYVEAMNAGQRAFAVGLDSNDVGEIERAIKQVEAVPSVDEKPDALRNELKALLARAQEFAAQAPDQRKTRRAQAQLKGLLTDYQAWEKRFDEWVRTEGERYGLKIVEDTPAPPSSPGGK